MNDSNYYSSDSLYTSQNKSIVVIDSRNSTYNNMKRPQRGRNSARIIVLLKNLS